ncbi:hypothetical protein CVU37_02855 [candidate division BRC1 bacterium HGW-BRC1-1]|nr:MAG: hypothetical protein CVU37_02855 [candidate division BRC1 bacterium HGW-BRC1-1]
MWAWARMPSFQKPSTELSASRRSASERLPATSKMLLGLQDALAQFGQPGYCVLKHEVSPMVVGVNGIAME